MNTVLSELTEEPGKLSFRGIRLLLVRPETLVGFLKASGADEAAAQGGFEGGRRSAAKFAETLRGRQVVEAMAAMGTDLGWGRFRVTAFDAGGFEVEIEGSAFAETWGRSEKPVCHFLGGVLAGVGTVVYGSGKAVETECLAAGAKSCRFACLHD